MALFNRVYLETNVLIRAKWPGLSTALENLLRLAQVLKVGVYLPLAVEVELEQHWIRDFDDKCMKAKGSIEALKKYVAGIVTDDFDFRLPDKSRALSNYRDKVQQLIERWGIRGVPLTSRSVEELLRMAASHHPPFKAKDVGFRDAVIFLSVIDHLLAESESEGVLVSQDEVFREPAISEFAKSQGVSLRIYSSVDEAYDAIGERLEEAFRKAWEKDNQKVADILESKLEDIKRFVTENLRVAEWELGLGFIANLIGITKLDVRRITNVRTPPLVDRKPAEPLQISFDVEANISVAFWDFPAPVRPPLAVGEVRDPLLNEIFSGQVQPPTRQEKVIERTLEVEAIATPAQGRYNEIKFTSVRLKGSRLGLARDLK